MLHISLQSVMVHMREVIQNNASLLVPVVLMHHKHKAINQRSSQIILAQLHLHQMAKEEKRLDICANQLLIAKKECVVHRLIILINRCLT